MIQTLGVFMNESTYFLKWHPLPLNPADHVDIEYILLFWTLVITCQTYICWYTFTQQIVWWLNESCDQNIYLGYIL